MIRFACPGCGKRYQVDDALAGRKSQCKACGAGMKIPVPRNGPSSSGLGSAGSRSGSNIAIESVDDPYGLEEGALGEPSGAIPALPVWHAVGRSAYGGSSANDGGMPPWIWAIGGGGALVVVGLIALVMMRGSGDSPPPNDPDTLLAREDDRAEDTATAAAASPVARPAPATFPTITPAAAPASVWKLAVDPPPLSDGPYPEDLDLAIPVPDHYGGTPVIFPTTPSPFVLLGGNAIEAQKRVLYDLRSGALAGQLTGLKGNAIFKPFALRGDGQYLATRDINDKPNHIRVYALADGRVVASIEIPDGFLPDVLDFAGSDSLFLSHASSGRSELWSISTQEKARDIPLPKLWNADSFAISPGLRFIAIATGYFDVPQIQFFDLATGTKVATLDLPTDGSTKSTVKGAAFSPDGSAFSALLELSQRQHLMTWDVATGALESHHQPSDQNAYGGAGSISDGRALRWLPDQSGWLVHEQAFVERSSGQRVWTVPFDRAQGLEPAPRKVLGLGRIAALVKSGNTELLKTVALPADRVSQAMAAAKSGGSAVDALLNPLVSVDLAAAPRAPTPARSVAWSGFPDPPTAAGKPLPRKPMRLPAKATELINIVFSDPDTALLAILSGPGGRVAGDDRAEQGTGDRVVHRINHATGQLAGQFQIPAVFELKAMSPDGTRLLLMPAKARDRIDIITADAGSPVASWRPCADDARITWAAFVDTERVLSADDTGTLALWTIADGSVTPVYIAPGVVPLPEPALSPGRRFVAGFDAGAILLIEAATGQVVGRVPAPSGDGSGPRAMAFRADGNELAAAVNDTLARVSLADGALVREVACPDVIQEVSRLACAGETNLLVNDTVLVDTAHGRATWFFHGGVPAEFGDGAFWIAANPQILDPAILTPIDLPGQELSQAVAAAFDPASRAVLKPGGKLAIEIQGDPPRDNRDYRQTLGDAIAVKAREQGLQVDGNAPARLVIALGERNPQQIELTRFAPGQSQPQKVSVTISEVAWTVTLQDKQGQPVPVDSGAIGIPYILSMSVPNRENDLQSFVRQALWEEASRKISSDLLVPFYASRRGQPAVLPGQTDLGWPRR